MFPVDKLTIGLWTKMDVSSRIKRCATRERLGNQRTAGELTGSLDGSKFRPKLRVNSLLTSVLHSLPLVEPSII